MISNTVSLKTISKTETKTVTQSQIKTVTKTATTPSPTPTHAKQLNPQFLHAFTLVMPIGYKDIPLEISIPQLEYYQHPTYLYVESDSILVMKTPASGVKNLESKFPETGLIETNDDYVEFWDPDNGIHAMEGTISLHHLYTLIPEISVAEIYCEEKNIMKLVLTGDGDITARLNANSFQIGKFILKKSFSFKFLVYQSTLKVFLNDKEQFVYQLDAKYSNLYFRVGSFPQSGVAQGEDAFDYSEVWIHEIYVLHGSELQKRFSQLIFPSQIIDLSIWKLALPIGLSEDPIEISQPALSSYYHPDYF
jgi:hypothetical protein